MEDNAAHIIVAIKPEDISKYIETNLTETAEKPLQVIDNFFRNILFEQVMAQLANKIVREPRIIVHENYHKQICLSLKGLAQKGYQNWYMEIISKISLKSNISSLDIKTNGFTVTFLSYEDQYAGIKNYAKELKTQRNIRTVLNRVFVPSKTFENSYHFFNNRDIGLMADLHRVTLDRMGLLPIYIDKITGNEFYCSCTVDCAKETGGMIAGTEIKDNICHFCIADRNGIDAVNKLYGEEHIFWNLPFIYQIQLQKRVPQPTARAIAFEKLDISKWKSEALLFAIVRQLFQGELVYREYSPSWLTPQRIDIYIPGANLAIEYQGEQHFHPVQAFGGADSFLKNQQRDKRKYGLCQTNEVYLEYVKFTEPLTLDYIKNRFKKYLSKKE